MDYAKIRLNVRLDAVELTQLVVAINSSLLDRLQLVLNQWKSPSSFPLQPKRFLVAELRCHLEESLSYNQRLTGSENVWNISRPHST